GPAGAGMDRWMRLRRRRLIRRPRRRGDGPDSRADTTDETGSAPQARGWTSLVITTPVTLDIGPAGAGMDPDHRTSPAPNHHRPRRRGDGPVLVGLLRGGWCIGPAGARMDPSTRLVTRARANRPRRRGDGPDLLGDATEARIIGVDRPVPSTGPPPRRDLPHRW